VSGGQKYTLWSEKKLNSMSVYVTDEIYAKRSARRLNEYYATDLFALKITSDVTCIKYANKKTKFTRRKYNTHS